MCPSTAFKSILSIFLLVCFVPFLCPSTSSAAIDPKNMGKGDQIWMISSAMSAVGATSVQGLIDYEKNKGMKWLIVKCANSGTWMSQFNADLVTRCHNSGLQIIGYQRCYGTNVTNEINMGKQCIAMGADGYMIDAEAEYEGKASLATQMMSGLRAAYPTAFIGYTTFPYIDYHTSFPYVQFASKCDVSMPQCYWTAIGVSPTTMVADLNSQWSKWYNTWRGNGNSAAVKPIVPIGQSYSGTPGSEMTTFVNGLKNTTNPPESSGYQGVSFWSCQHRNADEWSALGAITIGGGAPPPPPPGGTDVIVDNANATIVGSWSTGTSAADKYGSDYRYKSAGTGSAYLQYAPNLSASGSYQVFEWHSAGTNRTTAAPHTITYSGSSTTINVNQQANGGKWNLLGTWSFASGTAGNVKIKDSFTGSSYVVIADAVRFTKITTVADIIVDNSNSGFAASTNWSTGTSSTDKYGADYRYHATGSTTDRATYSFNISTALSYEIYAWWPQGSNRSTATPYILPDSSTVTVNQQTSGGMWNSLGIKSLSTGTKTVKVDCTPAAGYVVMADAIKIVAR